MDKQKKRDSVLVNAIPLLRDLTGVGHVVSEVSRRLDQDQRFRVRFYTRAWTFAQFDAVCRPKLRTHPYLFFLRVVKGLFRRLPFSGVLQSTYGKITGADKVPYGLYWEPNFIPVDAIPAQRILTTVHDMAFHEHPEWLPDRRLEYFTTNFFANICRSDIVVTVSGFTRDRFLKSCPGFSPERVRVIPCGVNHDRFQVLPPEKVEEFRANHQLPERFVLFVGSIEPRKNLVNLLAAYEQLSPERREAYPLVLVGGSGWKNDDIHSRILALGQAVRTFGYLENQGDLALMYNAATVFVYPSLYEGFGIPPLEAMACGTPVCLSSIPVFHEVYGSDAACYVDPLSPAAITHGLIRLFDDEAHRSQLAEKGMQLAQRYTWDHTYEQYAELFQELMSS